MGQLLHGCARTKEAVRRAIRGSQESLRALAARYGINQKTVRKWRGREQVVDRKTGPRDPRSAVLSPEQEAIIVAFRRHTPLPLDDCLNALQATIDSLFASPLPVAPRHQLLAEVEGDKPARSKFNSYLIGCFHVNLAEVRTAEGKLHLFVAIDRTSKFAFTQLLDCADMAAAAGFLETLIEAVPYQIPHGAYRQWHPVRRSAQKP